MTAKHDFSLLYTGCGRSSPGGVLYQQASHSRKRKKEATLLWVQALGPAGCLKGNFHPNDGNVSSSSIWRKTDVKDPSSVGTKSSLKLCGQFSPCDWDTYDFIGWIKNHPKVTLPPQKHAIKAMEATANEIAAALVREPRVSQAALRAHRPPASERDTRDSGSIPASGRSPREGNGNWLQASCLGKLMDRGAWWATVRRVSKNQTRLSDGAGTQRIRNALRLAWEHLSWEIRWWLTVAISFFLLWSSFFHSVRD